MFSKDFYLSSRFWQKSRLIIHKQGGLRSVDLIQKVGKRFWKKKEKKEEGRNWWGTPFIYSTRSPGKLKFLSHRHPDRSFPFRVDMPPVSAVGHSQQLLSLRDVTPLVKSCWIWPLLSILDRSGCSCSSLACPTLSPSIDFLDPLQAHSP